MSIVGLPSTLFFLLLLAVDIVLFIYLGALLYEGFHWIRSGAMKRWWCAPPGPLRDDLLHLHAFIRTVWRRTRRILRL